MDLPEPSRRARRALPLIAGALAAMVVAGLVYLHPGFPSMPKGPVALPSSGPSPSLVPNQYSTRYGFVSETAGWALVVGPQSGPAHWYVYKTTDGAKHWTMQLNAYSAYPAITGIKFFDSTHGVIATGNPSQLYRTSDGGAHWDTVPLPLSRYQANAITFTDPAHGWLTVSEGDLASLPHFFATTDGGSTWNELVWPKWATWGGKGGVIGGDLPFRRPGEGWLGANASQPTVYSTSDGGASWQPHTLPSLPEPIPTPGGKPIPPNFPGSTYSTSVSLLPGAGVIATINYDVRAGVYTSFDGGNTWRVIASPPGNTTYSDFVFQDSTHWWAMRFGTLYKSSDAGQTWRWVSQQLDQWDYRPQIIDSKHAWSELSDPRTPGHGLASTSDGGLHWKQVNAPLPA